MSIFGIDIDLDGDKDIMDDLIMMEIINEEEKEDEDQEPEEE